MQTLNRLSLAIYKSVHESPLGLKGIALELGIGEQVFRNKVNPHCETHKVSSYEMARIIEVTKDTRIAQVISDLSGGQFNQTSDEQSMTVLDAVIAMVVEQGDVVRTVQEALSDGKITLREADVINQQITEQIDTLLILRKSVSVKTDEDARGIV